MFIMSKGEFHKIFDICIFILSNSSASIFEYSAIVI